jgi:competence protein ComEA
VPAASTALPVDVNRASAAELEAVPGIGPVLAQRILALRAERGRFASLAELKQVKGIKDKRLARLAPYLTLGQGSSG